jgi:acyl dehydratase
MEQARRIVVDAKVPEISLDVTFTRVAMVGAATRDFFPGHHDPEYARSQGKESIYFNTMSIGAFLDRVTTDWLGPDWFIRRRVLRMIESIFPGQTLRADGIVTEVSKEAGHIRDVTISVTARTEEVICATAQITLEAPGVRRRAAR